MLRILYRQSKLFLEKRPWGIQMLYHSVLHWRTYETLEALSTTIILVLIFRTFFFQPFKIPSESMEPTLLVGDRLFVNKLVYYFHPPQVGDIVVFKTPDSIHDPHKPVYIKRVVGLEGNEVSIEGGHLFVNGTTPEHPVIQSNQYFNQVEDANTRMPKTYNGEIVPPGEVYVFGDNSNNSYDSRYWGGVPVENIKGRAALRWWPPHRFGWIE